MENITSYFADSSFVTVGIECLLKIDENKNPEIILTHVIIHKSNVQSRNISTVFNVVGELIIICINAFKVNVKCERHFKQFCKSKNADHMRLLL